MKKTYRALSEQEKREYRQLFKMVGELWKLERQESYNLSYIIKDNEPIYCFYIFKYELVDGSKKYNRPNKIFRRYGNMKEYLEKYKNFNTDYK